MGGNANCSTLKTILIYETNIIQTWRHDGPIQNIVTPPLRVFFVVCLFFLSNHCLTQQCLHSVSQDLYLIEIVMKLRPCVT